MIGTRKFSVKSSERPTTMKTKPMPKPIAPIRWAAFSPNRGVSDATASTKTTSPTATSKPPMSAVAPSSSNGRESLRRPSSRVRS